MLIVSYTWG